MPLPDAEAMAEPFTRQEDDVRFSSEIEKDHLIDALDVDGSSLLGAATYGDQQEITLVVSAGALPDLSGKTPDEARELLAAVGLTVSDDLEQQNNHDTVPEGTVIGLVDTGGAPIRPGDTVGLNISSGPAPVAVPAIVGMSWTDAKAALEAAGLRYDFDREIDEQLAESFPNSSRVTQADPAPGAMARRGDTVIVRLAVG
jgi:serine/threonine-protein kinase